MLSPVSKSIESKSSLVYLMPELAVNWGAHVRLPRPV